MKKILSLLALMMLSIVGANAETVKYALSEGDTFTSGQTVEVKNGAGDVVATITYGESGGADFKAAKAYTGIEGYTAYTEGNGTNGNKEGGTFYTITPKIDATISVAVCLNADKAFFIEEDGTALEAYNGIKVDAKYYGTYEFDATADKAYKVYCAGSKLGFFGFEMTTAEAGETYTIGANVNGMGANMDLTLAEGATLPYTATFADCYRGAMGSEPAAMIQIQNAVVTSGTNVTIGTLNGWDTTFTISEEGTSEISLTLNVGAMTITVNVAKYIPAETKTFTLVPGPWDVDGARYAAWTWSNGEDGQWIDFTKVGETYTINIPAANTGLILARMNGETTENNWEEGTLWNKTGDIDITNVADNSVFTITGWGESDYTISAAATPLEAAKAALQAAIDKVKAYNTTGLAEVIAAAEAAIADENATIESIQAAAAAFEAGVKAYLKEILAKAIPMLEGLNAETLTDCINAAKAALENEDATAQQLAEALFGMMEPARPYIVGILQQTVDVCKSLGIDTATAEAVLSQGDEASTVGLALTLYSLTQTAIPAVQEVVNNLQAYMTVFSSDAATALAEDFAKLAADVNNGDIAAVKNDIEALMVKGKTYLQADIVKLEGYVAVLNNEAITADVAAMKAAVEAGNFANLLAAVEKFKVDFLAEAPSFVNRIEYAAAGYKDAGKTHAMEQLEAAIAAAKQALAAEDATIVTVGLAIRNLIVAVQTHLAANSTYTIAGTKDLTGTENDWDIVEANNMTKSAEQYMYEWTAENITINAENQPQFKVVITDIDGVNQTWIPASEEGDDHNWVITPNVVGGEGVYNITITYNVKTQEIGVTGEIVTANIATFNFADPNFRENIGESMADTKGFIYNETFTTEGVSLQITAGSAPSRIYVDNNRGQNLVTYKEYATLTFRAPEGKAITKIEFTGAGTSLNSIKNFTASSGVIDGDANIWTGNAAGVRFLQGGTSYLANAIVTLEATTAETAALPAIEYVECENIAAFNALEAGTYAKVHFKDAEIIGKSADGYSTVWIQDATGGAWIQYTSLNDFLQEGNKVNGAVSVIKRVTAGNPQMKEAEDTPFGSIMMGAISSYTTVEGTIAEVNVAANLNKVVKISGATLAMTSASAGKLTLGESTIDVNNGTETANQQLHKIADWEKDKVLENITITAILVAKSATANQLLPISIEYEYEYTVVGGYGTEEGGIEDPIFGTTWDPTLEDNNMKKGDDGVYTLVCNDVELTPGQSILYKVVRSHSWDINWGFNGGNADYFVNLPEGKTLPEGKDKGVFDITFKFNPVTPFENNYNVDCVVVYKEPTTTGINGIATEAVEKGNVYNLNGQKVTKTQKGLYIINGRKQVVK